MKPTKHNQLSSPPTGVDARRRLDKTNGAAIEQQSSVSSANLDSQTTAQQLTASEELTKMFLAALCCVLLVVAVVMYYRSNLKTVVIKRNSSSQTVAETRDEATLEHSPVDSIDVIIHNHNQNDEAELVAAK